MPDLAELTIKITTQGVRNATSELDRFGTVSRSASGALGAFVAGLAGLGAVRSATQSIAAFGLTMAQLRGQLQISAAAGADLTKVFADVEAAAKRVGATSQFSASEAAEALLGLVRAGFDASRAVGLLPQVADAATAGVVSLSETVSIAAGALNAFSKQGLAFNQVSGGLISVANATDSDFRDLGEGLKLAAAAAGPLNQSFFDITAALGILADAQLKGTVGGTTLASTISALVKPSEEAKRIIAGLTQQFGLSADAFDISRRSIIDVIATIRELNLPVSTLAQLFGSIDAGRGGLILTQQVEKLRKIAEDARGAGNLAAQLSQVIGNTLRGSILNFQSAIEALQISAGDRGLAGVLRGIIDFGTDVIRVLGGVKAEIQTSAVAVQAAVSALAGLAAGFSVIVSARILGGIRALTAAMLTLGAVNPITAIAAGVGLAVAAFQQFKDELISVGDQVVSVGEFADALFGAIGDGARAFADVIVDRVKAAFDQVLSFFRGLGNAWRALTKFLGVSWKDVFDGIFNIAKNVVNGVIALFVGLYRSILAIRDTIFQTFEALSKFDISDPLGSLDRVRAALAEIPQDFSGRLSEAIRSAFAEDYFSGFVDSFKGAASDIGETLFRALESNLNPLAAGLGAGLRTGFRLSLIHI